MLSLHVAGIVLDIEGTTSSVSYVYEVLFPYVRTHLEAFIAGHWNDPEFQRACQQLARDTGTASVAEWRGAADPGQQRDQVRAEILRLMDRDAKTTGLKELQGLIWRAGYEAGSLQSHVYDDVPPALEEWRRRGIDLSIYSSGSVTAQKLFFGHTSRGNLLPLLQAHFDTTVGGKRDPASYRRVATALQESPERLVFLSDVVEELDAARSVNWQTALVVRPGNAPAPANHVHPVISSLQQLQPRKWLGDPVE